MWVSWALLYTNVEGRMQDDPSNTPITFQRLPNSNLNNSTPIEPLSPNHTPLHTSSLHFKSQIALISISWHGQHCLINKSDNQSWFLRLLSPSNKLFCYCVFTPWQCNKITRYYLWSWFSKEMGLERQKPPNKNQGVLSGLTDWDLGHRLKLTSYICPLHPPPSIQTHLYLNQVSFLNLLIIHTNTSGTTDFCLIARMSKSTAHPAHKVGINIAETVLSNSRWCHWASQYHALHSLAFLNMFVLRWKGIDNETVPAKHRWNAQAQLAHKQITGTLNVSMSKSFMP